MIKRKVATPALARRHESMAECFRRQRLLWAGPGENARTGRSPRWSTLIEGGHGAPGTVASSFWASSDPPRRRRNQHPGNVPKSSRFQTLKTPRFQGGFRPPKTPLNRRFTGRNHPANARVHHYFLPPRPPPTAARNPLFFRASSALFPGKSRFIHYFCPPTVLAARGDAAMPTWRMRAPCCSAVSMWNGPAPTLAPSG